METLLWWINFGAKDTYTNIMLDKMSSTNFQCLANVIKILRESKLEIKYSNNFFRNIALFWNTKSILKTLSMFEEYNLEIKCDKYFFNSRTFSKYKDIDIIKKWFEDHNINIDKE